VLQKGGVSGDGQTAVVTTALPTPLTIVALVDGAPAAGVVVTFIPTAGSGSVLPVIDTTGADGVASTHWTLPASAGAKIVTANVSGASGSPQTFHATALPDAPVSIVPDSGNSQVQEAGATFQLPLRARVLDAFGNGVPGVSLN